jgi:hypothetical protein
MKLSDRRLARRFPLTIPVYVRDWKSQALEEKVASVNVSECGVCFETDKPPREGTMLQIRLEMPKEVTGQPAVEWRCAGKVVRIQPPDSSLSPFLGVSVRFDYYEISRTTSPVPALASSLIV